VAVAKATDNEYTTTAMNGDLPPNHEKREDEAYPRQPQHHYYPHAQEYNYYHPPQHYQQYPTHQYPPHYPPHQHHYPPDPQYDRHNERPYHYPPSHEQLQHQPPEQYNNNNNIPIERTSTHDTEMQEVIVEAVEYAQRAEEVDEKNGEFSCAFFHTKKCAIERMLVYSLLIRTRKCITLVLVYDFCIVWGFCTAKHDDMKRCLRKCA